MKLPLPICAGFNLLGWIIYLIRFIVSNLFTAYDIPYLIFMCLIPDALLLLGFFLWIDYDYFDFRHSGEKRYTVGAFIKYNIGTFIKQIIFYVLCIIAVLFGLMGICFAAAGGYTVG